jgi:hypothetical protein
MQLRHVLSSLMIAQTFAGEGIPLYSLYDWQESRDVMCQEVKRGFQHFECCSDRDQCLKVDKYAEKCCNQQESMSVSRSCTDQFGWNLFRIIEEQGYYTENMMNERKQYAWSFDSLKLLNPSITYSAITPMEELDLDRTFAQVGLGQGVENEVEPTPMGKKMNSIASQIPMIEALGATKVMPEYYNGKTLAQVAITPFGDEGLDLPSLVELIDDSSVDSELGEVGAFIAIANAIIEQALNSSTTPTPEKLFDDTSFHLIDAMRKQSAYTFSKKPNGDWTINVAVSQADSVAMVRPSVNVLDVWHLDGYQIEDCPICEKMTFSSNSDASLTVIEIEYEEIIRFEESAEQGFFYVGQEVKKQWTRNSFLGEALFQHTSYQNSNRQFMILEQFKENNVIHDNVMIYKGLMVQMSDGIYPGFYIPQWQDYLYPPGGWTLRREDNAVFGNPYVYYPVYDVGSRGWRMSMGFNVEATLDPNFDPDTATEDDLILFRGTYPATVTMHTSDWLINQCSKIRHEFVEYLEFENALTSQVTFPVLLYPPSPPPPPLRPLDALIPAIEANPCQCTSPELFCQAITYDGRAIGIPEESCGCGGNGDSSCYTISGTCTTAKLQELGLVGTVGNSSTFPGLVFTGNSYCGFPYPPASPSPPSPPPSPPMPPLAPCNDITLRLDIYVQNWPEEAKVEVLDNTTLLDTVTLQGSGKGTGVQESKTWCLPSKTYSLKMYDSYGDGWGNSGDGKYYAYFTKPAEKEAVHLVRSSGETYTGIGDGTDLYEFASGGKSSPIEFTISI